LSCGKEQGRELKGLELVQVLQQKRVQVRRIWSKGWDSLG
jgi:hypothetical protein